MVLNMATRAGSILDFFFFWDWKHIFTRRLSGGLRSYVSGNVKAAWMEQRECQWMSLLSATFWAMEDSIDV